MESDKLGSDLGSASCYLYVDLGKKLNPLSVSFLIREVKITIISTS